MDHGRVGTPNYINAPTHRLDPKGYKASKICRESIFPEPSKNLVTVERGRVDAKWTDVLWVTSENPILVGRFLDPYFQTQEGGNYKQAEKFIINRFKDVVKTQGGTHRNVDAQRYVCKEEYNELKSKKIVHDKFVQGLEIKYMPGFHTKGPRHIRGSIVQMETLRDPKIYAQPSGYVVVSRELMRRTARQKEWVFTVWFLRVDRRQNWKYIHLHEIGLGTEPQVTNYLYDQNQNLKESSFNIQYKNTIGDNYTPGHDVTTPNLFGPRSRKRKSDNQTSCTKSNKKKTVIRNLLPNL